MRGPLWRKAHREEVPVKQEDLLHEAGDSEDEEVSQHAECYTSNNIEVDGDVDEEESRNQPDDASNHKEVNGDVGSQVLWDEALEEAV
jgi:hypothetical protein